MVYYAYETAFDWRISEIGGKQMRFHILKSSTTKFLLISDSQTQYLNYRNLNILSIPGGKVCHARNFLPKKGAYDIIITFNGGNDLFEKTTRAGIPAFSSVTAVQVANELIELAEEALLLTKKVYVLAIPFRFDGAAAKKRVSAVNELLRKREQGYRYRGVSKRINASHHLGSDDIHLSEQGLVGLRSILKNNILYENYSTDIHNAGHIQRHECSGNKCKCGLYSA